MRAHGYVPGPTQRPTTAGLIDGALASIPALLLLRVSGSLDAVGRSAQLPILAVLAIDIALLAVAGALYGRIFGRTANDREGGWLFGLCYGFAVWMAGPATVLQWAFGRPLVTGRPALMLCAAHLAYGLVLGLLFPYVHSFLQKK